MKLLKRRSDRPVRRLLAATRSSSVAISQTSRSLRASPNRKSTPLGLAPSHQVIPCKAAVGAQQDTYPRPPTPNLRDDACYLLDRAGRRVQVGTPQLGDEQMAAAEHVERQVAVAIVIAVEEPPLLLAVQRIIRRIEVENDLPGRPRMRLQEQVEQQRPDRDRIVADLVVARRRRARSAPAD